MKIETDILRKYFNNSINQKELQELRSIFLDGKTDVAEQILEKEWMDYSNKSMAPLVVFEKISNKLGFDAKSTHLPSAKRAHFRWINVAASILVCLCIGSSIYLFDRNNKMERFLSNKMDVAVNSGERANLILPDGTKVKLNAATQISFPSNFGYANRKIYLNGEAYFEVTKDSLKQFMVETQHLSIQVLGTEFNVKAYENEDIIETTLIKGEVKVSTNQKSIVLSPKEKAIFNKKTGILTKEKSDLRLETAWVNGELVFKSSLFSEMLQQLSLTYGIRFEVHGDTSSLQRYTGTFEANNISEVLELLKIHYPIDYSLVNNKAILTIKN